MKSAVDVLINEFLDLFNKGVLKIDVDNETQNDDLPFIDSDRNNVSLKYTKRRYDRGFHRRNNFNHNIHQTIY